MEKEDAEQSAGNLAAYSAGGVTFNMIYVPAVSYFTGTGDSGTMFISGSYWIAETEVTYELWNVVYLWAADSARGTGRYYFANPGTMGDGFGDKDLHPVTTINWRDAVVWCNALTEWYNAIKGSNFGCVYKYDDETVRDSRDSNAAQCDAVVQDSNAKGFRIQTWVQWELAARYINNTNNDSTITGTGEYYPGDHVSGDTTAYCYPSDSGTSTVFGNYAWYDGNSGGSTHAVKTAVKNALGIYDMCGNVVEFCFEPFAGNNAYRTVKGGGYMWGAVDLRIGASYFSVPDEDDSNHGFRIVKK